MSNTDAEIAEVADQLASRVSVLLGLREAEAELLIERVGHLYMDRMTSRFTDLRFRERLKRTNPFLLKVRGVTTVRQWAENEVMSSLFASEEEAVGHVLEAIAKACHPNAREPLVVDDFDFEVEEEDRVTSYQVKMSWDCMPMSTRRNLSNTIRRMRAHYEAQGKQYEGIFAPCYGRTRTSRPPGQEYTTLRSRDFWTQVGSGDEDFDTKVGTVCGLLCSEFRHEFSQSVVPDLIDRLTDEGAAAFGTPERDIDYERLFRRING